MRDKVTELRRRKVGPAEKYELDQQIKEIREFESRLKNQIDFQMKQIESSPRTPESTQKRAGLSKLTKDFDRVKAGLQAICNDSTMIKVTQEGGQGAKFARTGDTDSGASEDFSGMKSNPQFEPQLQVIGHGQEVDDAIREERERDIQKMNKDLILVNEMMR